MVKCCCHCTNPYCILANQEEANQQIHDCSGPAVAWSWNLILRVGLGFIFAPKPNYVLQEFHAHMSLFTACCDLKWNKLQVNSDFDGRSGTTIFGPNFSIQTAHLMIYQLCMRLSIKQVTGFRQQLHSTLCNCLWFWSLALCGCGLTTRVVDMCLVTLLSLRKSK